MSPPMRIYRGRSDLLDFIDRYSLRNCADLGLDPHFDRAVEHVHQLSDVHSSTFNRKHWDAVVAAAMSKSTHSIEMQERLLEMLYHRLTSEHRLVLDSLRTLDELPLNILEAPAANDLVNLNILTIVVRSSIHKEFYAMTQLGYALILCANNEEHRRHGD